MIASKVSLHLGSRFNVRHNLRQYDKEKWNKDGHIDKERERYNEVLANIDVKQFFDKLFGDALVDYDMKNESKHPERVFGLNKIDYETAVQEKGTEFADTLRRQKAVSRYFQQQKKNIKECITQLGDETEFKQLVEKVGIDKAREIHSEYLKDFYEKWQEQNPTLKVFCATIHLDEATPHLHLTFLPVAQSTKGLTTKVSMDGALKELGYARSKQEKYSETPFKRWLKDFRSNNEQRSQHFLNQKIPKTFLILPSETTTKGHTQPEEHKAEVKKTEKMKQAVSDFITGKGRVREEAAQQIISNAKIAEKAITAQANAILEENKKQKMIISALSDELQRETENLKIREERVSEREKNADTKSDNLKNYEQSLLEREGSLNKKLLDTILRERQAREPLEEINRQTEYYLQQIRQQLRQKGKQTLKNRGYDE